MIDIDIRMVTILRCSNCGKEVPPEEHFFCPECGKSLTARRFARLPIVSGTLTIVAAFLAIAAASLTINDATASYGGWGPGFISGTNIFFWIAGVFQIIAFSIGIAGSIFQIRKQQILVGLFSNILLFVSAAILVGQSVFLTQLGGYYWFSDIWTSINFYLYYAIPAMVLLILSIALIGISRKEFKS